jgi:hypothetical protein
MKDGVEASLTLFSILVGALTWSGLLGGCVRRFFIGVSQNGAGGRQAT